MKTSPYYLPKLLQTEDERALFLQAMLQEGASEAEMESAHRIVEQSRLEFPPQGS